MWNRQPAAPASLDESVRARLAALAFEPAPRHFLTPDIPDDGGSVPARAPEFADASDGNVPRVDPPQSCQKTQGEGISGDPKSPRRAVHSGPGYRIPVGGELAGRVLDFTRSHVAAVAVVVLAGVLWALISVTRATTYPVALADPVISASMSPTASPSTPTAIRVHVIGEVRNPGVVEIPAGARVVDAITAAGGLTGNADPATLNLAEVIPDGAQLMIGSKRSPLGEIRMSLRSQDSASKPTSEASAGKARINLNTATLEQLDTLPGVGPVTGQRIIDWRTAHGSFATVQQLLEVSGIGDKSYAQIAPYVCV